MFRKFFAHEEEEEVFETVDPVLEQRRKEKFSAPLIYSDEEEVEEEKKEVVKKAEPKKAPLNESTYRMSEIISPMTGLKETKKPEVKVSKPKVKKVRKETDELIPIISPFYGPASFEEEKKVEPKKEKKKEPSVEENLRNIASIVEEEQDQLKIIEERTGEFKLDLQKKDEDSFIDEIDDSMSLDELMSLYEKEIQRLMKGIGVDIVDLDRLNIENQHFVQRILSKKEYSLFQQLKTDQRKREFLGGRFAGKEAYLKAYRKGIGGMSFHDIEILNHEDGSPYLNDENALISLSHEQKYAIAFVIVVI